jgi:hypothetical protein
MADLSPLCPRMIEHMTVRNLANNPIIPPHISCFGRPWFDGAVGAGTMSCTDQADQADGCAHESPWIAA